MRACNRAAKTDAGKYLEALIRAQIDAYTSDGRDANDADASKVMDALGKVWDEYKDKLQLGAGAERFYRSSEFPAKKTERDSMKMTRNIVGTNELVSKMGAWQEVLGFPTTHKAYSDLYPHNPQADPMLQRITGAWEWRPADSMDGLEGGATETPGEVYNNAPVKAVTRMPSGGSNWKSYVGPYTDPDQLL